MIINKKRNFFNRVINFFTGNLSCYEEISTDIKKFQQSQKEKIIALHENTKKTEKLIMSMDQITKTLSK